MTNATALKFPVAPGSLELGKSEWLDFLPFVSYSRVSNMSFPATLHFQPALPPFDSYITSRVLAQD